MVNESLHEGSLPASQKRAIITPLLNKLSLGADELNNYRPVSNLTFISKSVERIFAEQLVKYLQSTELLYHCDCSQHVGKTTQQRRRYSEYCQICVLQLTLNK